MLYFGGSILEVWESWDMKHVLSVYLVDTDFNSFCSSLPAPPHLGQADRQAFTTPCAAERVGEVCSKPLLLDFVFKFWAPWKMSATAEGRETRGCPVSVSTMPQQDRLHSKWLTEKGLYWWSPLSLVNSYEQHTGSWVKYQGVKEMWNPSTLSDTGRQLAVVTVLTCSALGGSLQAQGTSRTLEYETLNRPRLNFPLNSQTGSWSIT